MLASVAAAAAVGVAVGVSDPGSMVLASLLAACLRCRPGGPEAPEVDQKPWMCTELLRVRFGGVSCSCLVRKDEVYGWRFRRKLFRSRVRLVR